MLFFNIIGLQFSPFLITGHAVCGYLAIFGEQLVGHPYFASLRGEDITAVMLLLENDQTRI